MLAVVVVEGQVKQVELPAAEYVPIAHGKHPAAFRVPASVISPAYPGAQVAHDDTDVAPVVIPAVNTPAGHVVQSLAL